MNIKKFLTIGAIAFFTIPIFRSGGRTGLTGFKWFKEHTIYGSPVQYVPEEDYARELESAFEEIPKNSSGNFDFQQLAVCYK